MRFSKKKTIDALKLWFKIKRFIVIRDILYEDVHIGVVMHNGMKYTIGLKLSKKMQYTPYNYDTIGFPGHMQLSNDLILDYVVPCLMKSYEVSFMYEKDLSKSILDLKMFSSLEELMIWYDTHHLS